MKKVVSIFLLMVFLFSNSGIAINVHWCGGKLNSLKFFAKGPHKCMCRKKTMDPGCCKDKSTVLKANKDLSKTLQFLFKTLNIEYLNDKIIYTEGLITSDLKCCYADFYHPPPYKPKVPLYLRDCVFII